MTDISDPATYPDKEWVVWLRQTAPAIPSLVIANQTARLLQRTAAIPGLRPLEIAVLRSSTLEPLVPYFVYQAARAGFQARLWLSGYADWQTVAATADSMLWSQKRDLIVVALDLVALAPGLAHGFGGMDTDRVTAIVTRAASDMETLVSTLREQSNASVLVQNFPLTPYPAMGLYDTQSSFGQNEAIWRLNEALRAMTARLPGVYLFNACLWNARWGNDLMTDPRLELTSGMKLSRAALNPLALEYLRYLKPLMGIRRKCLVLDLDGTLWGGILGEDGYDGIQIGTTYPGNAYRAFQEAGLDLYHRGVILAVCSKNNEPEARDTLERHPEMVLRPHHFASLHINWEDKATHLQHIAAELNIGLDSLVFLDDNPSERALIRQMLPEVLTLDLPESPIEYASFVRSIAEFETLSLSDEDRQRGGMYHAQTQREKLVRTVASLEEYYTSLEMCLEMEAASAFTIPRIAQLTQKTNQFNLTTHRYTEAEIEEKISNPAWRVYAMRVLDRFGDNGLTGVALLCDLGSARWQFDTFLLSCRVLGRTVETAFLIFLMERIQEEKGLQVEGWFKPTAKNLPAQDFYHRHGFTAMQTTSQGTRWQYDLTTGLPAMPSWFRIRMQETSA